MHKLRIGLERAIQQKHVLRDLRKQEGGREIIDGMMNQVNRYITQCEKLAA